MPKQSTRVTEMDDAEYLPEGNEDPFDDTDNISPAVKALMKRFVSTTKEHLRNLMSPASERRRRVKFRNSKRPNPPVPKSIMRLVHTPNFHRCCTSCENSKSIYLLLSPLCTLNPRENPQPTPPNVPYLLLKKMNEIFMHIMLELYPSVPGSICALMRSSSREQAISMRHVGRC